MAKALVRARGVATPDQFKTDWSQFMKQNIAMNMMVYPNSLTMDKSDAEVSLKPAIPKAMVDKAQGTDKVFVCLCFKNDENVWVSHILELAFSDFSIALDLGGNEYLETKEKQVITIDASKVTATKVYDIHIVFSDSEITPEVAESVNDLPYVLYGPASEYVIEVTCVA